MHDLVVRKVCVFATRKNVLGIVVDKLVVSLIDHQPSIVFFAQLHDPLHLYERVHIARWVVGRCQHHLSPTGAINDVHVLGND